MWNKYKLAPIKSFLMAQEFIHEAHEKKQLMTLFASTGFGKTVGFQHYMETTSTNYYYAQIKPAEAAKPFFYRLNNIINDKENIQTNYKSSSSLNWLIEQSSYDVINNKKDPILIIDEAGNFKKNAQSYLRQTWDNIRGNAAMIVSGPDRYRMNLRDWNLDLSSGIPEFMSRINNTKTIPAPDYSDIELICRTNEIDEKKVIKYIFDNSHNLRNVKNYVVAHHDGTLGI